METLLDLFSSMQQLGTREAARWSDGYRTRVQTYTELCAQAGSIAAYLEGKGIHAGDRVLIWGENRPEWMAVFWACVGRGIEVVPVDFRFSPDLVRRIQADSEPRLMAHGDQVATDSIMIERLSFNDVALLPAASHFNFPPVSKDNVVELVYTSGTTGDPKAVVHRHRNICANLKPFEKEINRYKKWAAPFQPVRILNLLPLSHMFGQSLGLFIPALLGGSVSFMNDLSSASIVRTIHDQRISVVVSVPRILENLRNDIERQFHLPRPPAAVGWIGIAQKLWRYRKVHSRLGWKFWAFVVGGARVDPELEDFWGRLGFLVVQGYGLTETSPVVAVNHPFNIRRGSLGKVIEGQEVQIAPDGEILVRGESVITQNGEWLHTGDLGEIDKEGRLYYRGRKKDLIVTPEGLNILPEDIEAVLNQFPEIKESTVVASNEQVHAVLILKEPGAEPALLIQRANDRLEAHQRIRHWSIWPEEDFPRTASTMKVKRREVAASVAKGLARTETAIQQSSTDLSALSSLERVELLANLEHRYGIELDEEAFSKLTSTAELEQWMRQPHPAVPSSPISTWPQNFLVAWTRKAIQRGLVLPLSRHYMKMTVAGLENLVSLDPPVIFAANHASHLDTVAILAALPAKWRRQLAPAMAQEHFRAYFDRRHFARKRVWFSGLEYVLARGLFNAYPLPQRMSGVRQALSYTGELITRGYCPLVFPEGARTPDGLLHPFRPGIGMMAVRLKVPVVPIFLEGLFQVYSIHDGWPKRGRISVTIGSPLKFSSGTSYQEAAAEVEHAFREAKGRI